MYKFCLSTSLRLNHSLLTKRNWSSLLVRFFSDDSNSKLIKDDLNKTLIISDSTVKKLKSVLQDDEFLRVSIDSGGCKGFNYLFQIEKGLNPDDKVFTKENVKVVVDADSFEFLKGSVIDYSEELIRSSFRVQENPQMKEGCSCGASFAPKF